MIFLYTPLTFIYHYSLLYHACPPVDLNQGYFGNYTATGGGYPELSAREDSEELWHDWGRSRAGDLPRHPGGGAAPLKSRPPLPPPSSNATSSDGAPLQPTGTSQLLPPWALEPESGRIRRGRSAGLHGRFVVGGKALPWIHTVSGYVSALVAEGRTHDKKKAEGVEGAIVGGGRATENSLAISNEGSNNYSSSNSNGSRLRCQLQSLELAQCDKVGSSVIQALAECAAGSLTRLDIRNLDDLSPATATLGWLAQCKRLQEVWDSDKILFYCLFLSCKCSELTYHLVPSPFSLSLSCLHVQVDMRDSGLGEDHARTLAKRLPFAMKNHLDRRLLPRPLAVRLFNAHVYAQRTLEAAAVRIQMDWRRSLAERHVSFHVPRSNYMMAA